MNLYKDIFYLAGFICHQKPERSFHISHCQLPFCARCCGIIISVIASFILAQFVAFPMNAMAFLLFVPMIADGLVQKYTDYESTNFRRFITGFLFGLAYVYVFYMFGLNALWFWGCIINDRHFFNDNGSNLLAFIMCWLL